jgi:predicted dehydrogenase
VGVGGMMGLNDLQNFLQHKKVQIVALCDVDANYLKKAAELAPGARTYSDWREMLEKEGNRLDSVNVTAPDHMHFPIACQAIKARKHVYCQKPMCHDVAEVRALTQAAIQAKVVTQLGTQMASGVGDRTAVHLLRAGAVGKIRRAILCANRPGAIQAYRLLGPRPAGAQEPPTNLKWDLWLGTAPARAYWPDIYHPVKWRAWLDFGTGWSGDIGCHIFDAVWKGLRLGTPATVIAEVQESWRNSPARRADTWPQSNHITWTFPANSLIEGKELTAEWFDGEMYPPADARALFTTDNYPTESAMLLGTEGAMLIPSGQRPFLLPESKFKDYPRPRFEARNHYHHFVDACLGGEMTECHFAQTGPMTETILLGTVAVRVPGQRLEWNPEKMSIPNVAEANRYLRREYREGWRGVRV